jgi:hypothetical protein
MQSVDFEILLVGNFPLYFVSPCPLTATIDTRHKIRSIIYDSGISNAWPTAEYYPTAQGIVYQRTRLCMGVLLPGMQITSCLSISSSP